MSVISTPEDIKKAMEEGVSYELVVSEGEGMWKNEADGYLTKSTLVYEPRADEEGKVTVEKRILLNEPVKEKLRSMLGPCEILDRNDFFEEHYIDIESTDEMFLKYKVKKAPNERYGSEKDFLESMDRKTKQTEPEAIEFIDYDEQEKIKEIKEALIE